MSARLTPCARSRCSWLLLACLVVGCASDLIVRAPERLRPIAPAALDQVAPQRISVGAVANVPDVSAPVGTRDGGPLQPGGPIHLTEGVGTILRRTLMETLDDAGHHIVRQNADVHVAMRVEEFTVDVARQGIAWDVIVRVRLALRVAKRLEPLKRTHKRLHTRRGVLWLGQTCNLRCHFCYFIERIQSKEHPDRERGDQNPHSHSRYQPMWASGAPAHAESDSGWKK